MVEVIEKMKNFGFGRVPEFPVEAGSKAVRTRARVNVHLVEGIKNLLFREGGVKVSKLWDLLVVEVVKGEAPRGWRGGAKQGLEIRGENAYFLGVRGEI